MFISKSKKLVKPKAPARRSTRATTIEDPPIEPTLTEEVTDPERQIREEEERSTNEATKSFPVAPVAPMSSSAMETRRSGLRSQPQANSTAIAPEVDVQHQPETVMQTRSGRRFGNVTTPPPTIPGSDTNVYSSRTPAETIAIPDESEPVAPLTPPATQATVGGFLRKSRKVIAPKAQTRRRPAIAETSQAESQDDTTSNTTNGVTLANPIVVDEDLETDVAQILITALANSGQQSASADIGLSIGQDTTLPDSVHAANQRMLQSYGNVSNDGIVADATAEADSAPKQRKSRKRKQATVGVADGQETTQSASSKRSRAKKSASRPISVLPTDGTAPIQINEDESEPPIKTKDKKRKRLSTPENALTYRIEPTEVRMDALITDTHVGQVSKREQLLRQRDIELKERKLKVAQTVAREQFQEIMAEDEPSNLPDLTTTTSSTNVPTRSPSPDTTVAAPQFRIVNGQIVADESSRILDRRAERTRAAEAPDNSASVIEEDDLSKRINSRSFTKYDRPTRWSPAATELFHKGLQYFGLEFSMMACLFPGRSRRQLKAKFIREERADCALVNALLKDRQPIPSREELEAMMGKKLKDPKELAEELRLQKEALEEAQRVEDERAEERRLAREKDAEEEGRRVQDGNDDDDDDDEDENVEENDEEEEGNNAEPDNASNASEQEEQQEEEDDGIEEYE